MIVSVSYENHSSSGMFTPRRIAELAGGTCAGAGFGCEPHLMGSLHIFCALCGRPPRPPCSEQIPDIMSNCSTAQLLTHCTVCIVIQQRLQQGTLTDGVELKYIVSNCGYRVTLTFSRYCWWYDSAGQKVASCAISVTAPWIFALPASAICIA